MAILELQFPQCPRKRTKTHQGELSNAVFDTAWNDLLDVWAWKPEAQARKNSDNVVYFDGLAISCNVRAVAVPNR